MGLGLDPLGLWEEAESELVDLSEEGEELREEGWSLDP